LTTPKFLWGRPGQSLYFIGNPAVWMGVPALVLWHAGQAYRRHMRTTGAHGRLFLFATLLSYVPLLLLSATGRLLYPLSGLMPLLLATLYIGVTAEAWIAARAPWLIALLVTGFVALSPPT
jgi:hypothetical protein